MLFLTFKGLAPKKDSRKSDEKKNRAAGIIPDSPSIGISKRDRHRTHDRCSKGDAETGNDCGSGIEIGRKQLKNEEKLGSLVQDGVIPCCTFAFPYCTVSYSRLRRKWNK